MTKFLLTIGAILWTNYSQLLELPFLHPLASLYLYTSTGQEEDSNFFTTCLLSNQWTLFFKNEFNCSNLIIPTSSNDEMSDLDFDLYPSLSLGIHFQKELFLFPKQKFLCINLLNHENLILYLSDSDSDQLTDQEDSNCSPYIHLKYSLQLDSYLFLNWKSLISVAKDLDLTSNWHLMCASLEYSFLSLYQENSQKIPPPNLPNYLTILSSLNSHLDSFNFWLEFCNLESMITRIHQQSKQTDVSECLVNRVEGLSKNYEYDHTTSIICIEDIFPYLPSPSTSSAAAHFISSIGLDTLFLSNSNASLLQNHILDMNSMILAIQNLERSSSFSLVITSALKGFVKYLYEGTLPNYMNEIFTHLSSTTNLLQWRQSFSYFTFHMKDWFGARPGEGSSRDQKNVFLSELINKYLFIQYFDELLGREAMISSFEDLQQHGVISSDLFSRYLLGETLTRYVSYLTVDLPSTSTPSLLLPSGNYFHNLGNYFMNQQQLIERGNQEFFCQSHQILSYEISNYSVVSTTTHVIIFVTPLELDRARNLLQKWRSECQYCVLVIQYSIFVIPNTISLNVMTSSSQHQYRQILLILYDYLIHLVVDPDLVAVLIGFHSMKSLLQPGDKGLLPLPVIGGDSFVRLFSPLVFAAQNYHSPTSSSSTIPCSEINLNAFTGTSNQILHFLNHILHPSSPSTLRGCSDSSLRFSAFQYIHRYKELHDIRVDSNFQLFDFRGVDNDELTPNPSLLKSTDSDFISTIERAYQTINSASSFHNLYGIASNEYQLEDHLYGLALLFFLAQKNQELAEESAYLLHQTPRNFKFVSYWIPVQKKLDLIAFIETVFLVYLEKVDETPIKASFVTAVRRTLEIFYWDLGDVQSAINIYKEDSRRKLPYSEVQQQRRKWLQYRQQVRRKDRSPSAKYLTYADHMTPGLHNLLFSAKLSGIHLEVLGYGEQWSGFHQKFESYLRFIESSQVMDDDVVVILDGFDVLLLPSIGNILHQLLEFPTPIVTCAEYGPHIDRPSAWFYKRGGSQSSLGTKFVNSGCIVGRVFEMRNFLRETLFSMKAAHGDDQLAVMEYIFSHPHLISVDYSNQIFLCLYKFLASDLSFNSTSGVLDIHQKSSHIGLLHFNSGMVQDLANKFIIAFNAYWAQKNLTF